MFSRDVDNSFTLSFAGMVWPRAGVTAATLWNYQPGLSEEVLLEHTAWLASFLLMWGVKSCPGHCDCDELSACGAAYPILKRSSQSDDAALLQSCFPQESKDADYRSRELGPALDSWKGGLTPSLRMCYW